MDTNLYISALQRQPCLLKTNSTRVLVTWLITLRLIICPSSYKARLKIYFWAFVPLIDSAVKSGTGHEREKRWGVDRRIEPVSPMGVKPVCGRGYCLRHSVPLKCFFDHAYVHIIWKT